MKQYDAIAVHFGELWLKGGNRGAFISILRSNMEAALAGEKYELVNSRDRFMLRLKKGSDIKGMTGRLSRVFGISWFAPVVTCEEDAGSIIESSKALLAKSDRVRIEVERSDKSFKPDSQGLVSRFIRDSESLGFGLDSKAEKVLRIHITKDTCYMYTDRVRGAGGLPVGSAGKGVVLLSGGIDSPVAAYYAMKRGVKPIYLHIHGFQKNVEASASKMGDIVGKLSGYSGPAAAYYAPGHIFLSAAMPSKRYELVLFKRFAYRLAERVAAEEGADTIITGESLGQVASQTAKNLTASGAGIRTAILRPLIGFDKQEIIDKALEIGTYGLSVKPYRDVCSINAKSPELSATAEALDRMWDRCGMDEALERTFAASSKVVEA
ncbi:MAG: hypothetical protein KGH98_00595 [Candidatus Micrarchaeota archaeon]|nr:hypothetical protein [Candidatus Micrarchaeota archaeon]